MRRLSIIAVLVLAGLFTARASRADGTTEVSLVSFVGQSYSGTTNVISIPSFDPSQGTLDSVNVTIQGTFTDTIDTIPTITPDGPIPEPFQVELSQNLQGFMSFFAPTNIYIDGFTTGLGTPIEVVGQYIYTFTVDPTTDLIGAVPMSATVNVTAGPASVTTDPIPLAQGTLSDFQSPIPGVSIPLFGVEGTTVTAQGGTAFAEPPTDTGAVLVEYNYTTSIPDTGQTVPEPPTYALLFIGLALLVSLGRIANRRSLAAAL
jgi:hypothetical protein